MEKVKKKEYEAPGLTVVTFKLERGYAASSLTTVLGIWASQNPADNATGNGLTNFTVNDNSGSAWEW